MKAQKPINEKFIKQQLYLKDIFDFSDKELHSLKEIFSQYLSQNKDKYEAFEKAFSKVFSSKKICKC